LGKEEGGEEDDWERGGWIGGVDVTGDREGVLVG
jgi:hypothetical protein